MPYLVYIGPELELMHPSKQEKTEKTKDTSSIQILKTHSASQQVLALILIITILACLIHNTNCKPLISQ